MAVHLIEWDSGRILEVHASGKLTHSDYRRLTPRFERLVQTHGKIRVLFEMHDFKGWKATALWDDIKLDWNHFNSIERLAIVGDKRWQKWMSEICRPFTTSRVRYFNRADSPSARAWIAGKPRSADSAKPPILRVFQSRDQTRAYYNKISRFYDMLSDRSESPMRKSGLDLLRVKQGESVLEIGFGTGRTLATLARDAGSRGKVFGIDLSDRMLRLAKDTLASSGLLDRTQLRCGDATHLPYSDNTMHAVFMSFTLELFDTPEIPQVLGECKRVLCRGGRIVVVGMSKEGHRNAFIDAYEWTHKHFPNFVDCRPIYVRKVMEDAGFEIKNALIKRMWVPVEIVLGIKSPGKPDSPGSRK